MADQAPKRQIAQGPKGGYFIIGSEKVKGGRKRKEYISKEEYERMVARSGKADKPELVKNKDKQQAAEQKPVESAQKPEGKRSRKADKVEKPVADKQETTKQEPAVKQESVSKPEPSRIDHNTGFHIAGRKSKRRDSRLPEPGTKMQTPERMSLRIAAIEDQSGLFTIYNEQNKPAAVGYTLNAAVSSFFGKPVNGYALFGLGSRLPSDKKQKREGGDKPDYDGFGKTVSPEREKRPGKRKETSPDEAKEPKQPKEPKPPKEKKPRKRKPSGESKKTDGGLNRSDEDYFAKMKLRQKVKNWFRGDANRVRKIRAKGFDQFEVDTGKQKFMLKQKLDEEKNPTGPVWVKEKGADNKPFKATRKWAKQVQSRDGIPKQEGTNKEPGTEKTTVTGPQKLKAPDTLKKAFEISACIDTPNDAVFDVFADGIVIRSCIGRIRGFVPFDETLSGASDELVKAIPDDRIDSIRFDFGLTPRIPDDGLWQVDETAGYLRSNDIEAILENSCMVKAFCYDSRRMDFVGSESIDELCKALDIGDNMAENIQTGYPKEKSKYADPEAYKYPIDTEKHVKAALAYFGDPDNRKKYTEAKQKAMAKRMVAAAKSFDIEVSADSEVGKLAGIED